MKDEEDSKHKSFTLSVDKLITILLVMIVLTAAVFAFTFRSLDNKVAILQTRIERLEDSDMKMDNLKQRLLEDFMRKGSLTP